MTDEKNVKAQKKNKKPKWRKRKEFAHKKKKSKNKSDLIKSLKELQAYINSNYHSG